MCVFVCVVCGGNGNEVVGSGFLSFIGGGLCFFIVFFFPFFFSLFFSFLFLMFFFNVSSFCFCCRVFVLLVDRLMALKTSMVHFK